MLYHRSSSIIKKRAGSTYIYILGFPTHKDELILLLVGADVMGSTTVGTSTLYQNKLKKPTTKQGVDDTGPDHHGQSLLGPKQNYLQIQ